MSISGISSNGSYNLNIVPPSSSYVSPSSSPAQDGPASVQPGDQTNGQDSQQSGGPAVLSGLQQDFQNLTKALNSGDLVATHQAFAALQHDFQKAVGHRHYHHHHHSGDDGNNQTNGGNESGANNDAKGTELDLTITVVNISASMTSDNNGTSSQVKLTA